LVDSHLIAKILSILCFDLVNVRLEDLEARLLISIVDLAVGLLEIGKELSIVGLRLGCELTLDDRVDTLVEEAALVTLEAQPDVARFSPRASPGILDLPGLGVIADKQHTVIELLAIAGGEDTTPVALELAGVHSDRDWALHHCRLHGLGTLLHVPDTSDATPWDSSGAAALAAIAITSGVWITGLRARAMSLGVLDGAAHEATLATIAVLVAVNQLLLAERDKAACANLPGTFHGSGCREGPARATLALIFHSGHSALLGPVYRLCKGFAIVDVLTKGGNLRPQLARTTLHARKGAQELLLAEV